MGVIIDEKKQLRFHHIMDTNGAFYWIGTNEGRQPFNNPIRQGKVTAVLSSHGGEETACIADRNPESGTAENK